MVYNYKGQLTDYSIAYVITYCTTCDVNYLKLCQWQIYFFTNSVILFYFLNVLGFV